MHFLFAGGSAVISFYGRVLEGKEIYGTLFGGDEITARAKCKLFVQGSCSCFTPPRYEFSKEIGALLIVWA